MNKETVNLIFILCSAFLSCDATLYLLPVVCPVSFPSFLGPHSLFLKEELPGQMGTVVYRFNFVLPTLANSSLLTSVSSELFPNPTMGSLVPWLDTNMEYPSICVAFIG